MIDLSSPQRKRLILVILALSLVIWVVWESRQALIPFVIGGVIAYLMAPLVGIFEAAFPNRGFFSRLSRTVSILMTYGIVGGVLGLSGYYLIPPLASESINFVEQMPEYWNTVQSESDGFMRYYEQEVPERFRIQIEQNFDALGMRILNGVETALMATVSAVSTFVGFAAGLALLPLWMFYVLKDQERGKSSFYGMFPVTWREDVRNIVGIVDRVLSRYIRGQLLISLCVGVVTGITMWLIGINPPLVLGLLAFVTNLIPILGPVIAFFVIGLVTLATEPDQLLLVLVAFIVIQQLESTFLVPRVHGHAVKVNPAVVMVLVVIGSAMWGLWGMIIILPVAATLRDVFVYMYRRFGDDEVFRIEINE